jgi:MFS family permease
MSWREGSLRSLKYRNFRLFFLANLLSNTGTWAQRVAQDWLVVTDLHRGGSALGVVTGLQFLPMMLLSLYAGSLADRFDKRKLLILTNAGGGITAAVLGWLIIAHKVTILEVFILAFALGLFGALDTPVRQSFTSELVGTSDISNAVSLNSANFNLGRLIGPAISGILIKYFHTPVPSR